MEMLELIKVEVSAQDFYFYAWMCGAVMFFVVRIPLVILDIHSGGTGHLFPRGGAVLEFAVIVFWPLTITYLALRWVYRRFR